MVVAAGKEGRRKMPVRFEVSPCSVTNRMIDLISTISEKVGAGHGRIWMERDPGAAVLKDLSMTVNGMLIAYRKLKQDEMLTYRKTNLKHYPNVQKIPQLLDALFRWVSETKFHPLIRCAIFHYEFLFIHPFEENNEEASWLVLGYLLSGWKDVFADLPIEKMVRQTGWMLEKKVLSGAEAKDATGYVEWLLGILDKELGKALEEKYRSAEKYSEGPMPESLEEAENLLKLEQIEELVIREKNEEPEGNTHRERGSGKTGRTNGMSVEERVQRFMDCLGEETLSAKELMARLGINHPPTFRSNYLHPALESGLVERTIPDKPNSSNQKYRKTRKNLPNGFRKMFALDD